MTQENKMQNDELKACPHCNSKNCNESSFYPDDHIAGCRDCGAQTRSFDTAEKAIAAWNTRATANPPSVSGEVDAIKQLKEYYLPQLKFSMGGHRDFAIRHADKPDIAAAHHGAANAFETSIGCIEEALLNGGKEGE